MLAGNGSSRKFEERKELEITTVTPVFIGTGGEIRPLSFVIDRNEVLVVPDDFLSKLTPNQQERYVHWVDQQLAQSSRGFSLEKFLNSIGVSTDFVRGMNPHIVQFRKRPGRRGFREHIKHPDGAPYIPGTGIKGALRTSILLALLDDRGIYANVLERQLLDVQGRRKAIQKVAGSMEGVLLRARRHQDDAKYDLLRFISISDTDPFGRDDLFIEQIEVLGRGDNRYIPPFDLETLVAKRRSRFEIRFGAPKSVISGTDLGGMKEWLTLPKLLEACYKRSKAILYEEADYFTKRSLTLLSLVKSLQQQNTPSSPLLRLGSGQGFLGVTVDLQVKHRDPPLYESLRKQVSRRRKWHTYPGNFPKTRRVVVDRKGNPSTLLGWVQVSEPQE